MNFRENGHTSSINSCLDGEESIESEDDNDSEDAIEHREDSDAMNTLLAAACDDGCVRVYGVSGAEKLTYNRTLPRVSGRTLSVAWSPDASRIYSGSSDGFIRCWDAKLAHEIYRITVAIGGPGSGSDLCIWSILALRCGTFVSADSSGSVQFWDSQFGTLLQAHTYHKGDVNALTATPNHNRVFSAGSDGQVVNVGSAEVVHVFTPCSKDDVEELLPCESPITKMFTSINDEWLAAINCFGDLYIFNLETLRQHWFLSSLEGASVTAGGFMPQNSNILIISTSSNRVYGLDVEAKQLGEWSIQHTFSLPRRYQEFPGEVIGLSFSPSSSSSVIVYSPRAMCVIDFGLHVDRDK